jgi:hypothetical protein
LHATLKAGRSREGLGTRLSGLIDLD